MSLPEVNTILYTSSLGKHTRPVFRHAVKMASLYQAKIVMLHVVEPISDYGQAVIHNYLPDALIKTIHDDGLEQVKGTMKQRVVAFYEEEMAMLESPSKPVVEVVVADGKRSEEIVSLSQQIDADMIVMGSHNSFGRSSRTTRQVIKYAGRPVVVVPTRSAKK
ncbi:MAG: universal stress protein [Motiliproteus sp.]